MPVRPSKLNFFNLTGTELAYISQHSQTPERTMVQRNLLLFLSRLARYPSVDEEDIFLLGNKIYRNWSARHRKELSDEIQRHVPDRVARAFLDGFRNLESTKGAQEYTPSEQELNKLVSDIKTEDDGALVSRITDIVSRYESAVSIYGNMTIYLAALHSLIEAILRRTDARSTAVIANQLAYKGISATDENENFWVQWSRSLIVLGDLDDAELVLWAATRQHPDSPNIASRLASLVYRDQRRTGEAITLARSMVTQFPTYWFSRTLLADFLYERGGEAGRHEAVNLLVEQIKNRPKFRLQNISRLAKITCYVADGVDSLSGETKEIVGKVPTSPRVLLSLARLINTMDPGSKIAEEIARDVWGRWPDDTYAPNILAIVLRRRATPDSLQSAIAVLSTAVQRRPNDVWTGNHLAKALSETGAQEDRNKAVFILQNLKDNKKGDEYSNELLSTLLGGGQDARPDDGTVEQIAGGERDYDERYFSGYWRRPDLQVNLPEEVREQGELRRLRSWFETDDRNLREKASARLEKILEADDDVPSYARILGVRYGLWEGLDDELPSFAVAFEEALDAENLGKLRQLEGEIPRLDALILVARALYGDDEVAEYLFEFFKKEPDVQMHPAVKLLNNMFSAEVRPMNDNSELVTWLDSNRQRVLSALRDATEMTVEVYNKAA